jgi:hypothetical protein
MTAWQYAQLTVTRDIRAGDVQTILWRGPGQGIGENFTDSGQSVLELLNRGGCRRLGAGRLGGAPGTRRWPGYWDPNWAVTIYTFKNLVPASESAGRQPESRR